MRIRSWRSRFPLFASVLHRQIVMVLAPPITGEYERDDN
jgi:hypothetical protein